MLFANASKFLCCAFLFFFLVGASGCGSMKEKRLEEEAAAAQKRQEFDRLFQAIVAGDIKEGMSPSDIRSTYGNPDDVFSSGSGNSRLEIWVYGKSIERDRPEAWRPIRFYFNNNRLINWNY